VRFLFDEMIKHCCPQELARRNAEFEKEHAKSKDKATLRKKLDKELMGYLNLYTTTLHAINSAVVKLSKISSAVTVYRGVAKMGLPDSFWTANEFGVCGGIEGAFMSTTISRDVAMHYASSNDGPGVVFEMQQGMVSRGADISFLSQYPHEKEILFGPLTGLEVRSMHVDGAVLVVETAITVNLMSRTIDQVMGERKRLLRDFTAKLALEMREELASFGRVGALIFKERVARGPGSHPVAWYNNDGNLLAALQAVTDTKTDLLDLRKLIPLMSVAELREHERELEKLGSNSIDERRQQMLLAHNHLFTANEASSTAGRIAASEYMHDHFSFKLVCSYNRKTLDTTGVHPYTLVPDQEFNADELAQEIVLAPMAPVDL
jgi:hypothetical protein